jgi:hypothetical protein
MVPDLNQQARRVAASISIRLLRFVNDLRERRTGLSPTLRPLFRLRFVEEDSLFETENRSTVARYEFYHDEQKEEGSRP